MGRQESAKTKCSCPVGFDPALCMLLGTESTTEPHRQEVTAFYSFQRTALKTDLEPPLSACHMVLSPLTPARTLPSTTVRLTYGIISLTPAICLTFQVRTSGLRDGKLSQDAEGEDGKGMFVSSMFGSVHLSPNWVGGGPLCV